MKQNYQSALEAAATSLGAIVSASAEIDPMLDLPHPADAVERLAERYLRWLNRQAAIAYEELESERVRYWEEVRTKAQAGVAAYQAEEAAKHTTESIEGMTTEENN